MQYSPEDLLTPAQAAKLLGVTPHTIWVWAEKGLLPVAQKSLGGVRRYRYSDIQTALNQPEVADAN